MSGLTATGGASSLFTYDALGTRATTTLGNATKKFLTDGSNPLVEQDAAGAETATVATSGLDEYLTRTENNATQIYLTDALGTVVGLADTDGTVVTRYTYDPNGQSTTSGAASSNPYTFTGRESDGTGLLYYRNRYYDPETGRFISQDPIGHAGGTNLYQYALSSPTTYTDPSGNSPLLAGCVFGGLSEAGLDWLGQRLSGRKVDWGQVGVSAAMGCATGMLGAGGASKWASLGKCRKAGNSFTSDTPVLLADGTRKPIKDVRIGDEVLATDPETGETGPRPVTALIKGTGDKQLVDITLDTGASHSLTATDGHPFWVPALNRWVEADELTAGQWLRTSSGTWVQITAVTHRTTSTTVYNLTVADFHTYYVLAGATPVLVHNSNCLGIGPGWFPHGSGKIPSGWSGPNMTSKFRKNANKEGFVWRAPKGQDSVRIDRGDFNSQWGTQQVDHVVINSKGRIVGRGGELLPPNARIQDYPAEAHVPLSEWQTWRSWNAP